MKKGIGGRTHLDVTEVRTSTSYLYQIARMTIKRLTMYRFRFFITTLILFALATGLNGQNSFSCYVPVQDGTKLATDVYLPDSMVGEKAPVLAIFTRYWRASVNKKGELNPLSGIDRYFYENGYVIVKVDARGTGASFGTRNGEYTPTEVMDAKDVLDWIVAQPWCDGNIGSYGTSYEGTTAELLCATKHPALKAVIPGWSDFDVYRSPVRPYGMLASGFIRKWGLYVRLLDRNRKLILGESVRPVEEDQLKPALKEHKDNLRVFRATRDGEYRDSQLGEVSYGKCSPVHWEQEISESNVPMLVLTSWMDAGTAEGTLQRFQHFKNPQNIILMSTNHGGWIHASPFVVGDTLAHPQPGVWELRKYQLDFLNHHLKNEQNTVADWRKIFYFNMGEEVFHTTDEWPVKGSLAVPYYFQSEHGLSQQAPKGEGWAADKYRVDFSTTTGKKNRWTTQMGGPVKGLHDRGEEDAKMLTYTSAPLTEDLQITGTPVIKLHVSSTHEDGALFVYLEDVDENGQSRYITEGGLRLIHRAEVDDDEHPYNLHSFSAEAAEPMPKDSVVAVNFKMWPTSVLIKKGHSIRIAIAGADDDTFDRIPKRGRPVITVHRSEYQPSAILLPVVAGTTD